MNSDARPGGTRAPEPSDAGRPVDRDGGGPDAIDAAEDQQDGIEPEFGEGVPHNFEIGRPFSPWRLDCGFYPPDVVARQRNLTDGQKRLYERAVRWAGKNGAFWYGFETMADALGKSVRQVKDDMATLESMGLIRHTRRRRSSNVYSFLWHSMFEVQSTARQDPTLKVQDPTLEVQDGVILKVQPTAREFSQLESSQLNLGKADNKLITDDAPQKPRSAARPRMSVAEKSSKTKKSPKADPAPPNSALTPEAPKETAEWSPGDLAVVRRIITIFLGREPEEGFEVSVMLRARGATAADVCELLDRKHANPNCRVGGRWAPKNQNWFLAVIENEFNPGHISEPPATPQSQQPAESDMSNAGIEALELPDAPRPIVESVMCSKCGRAALVRYVDGTIDGCGCRR